MFIAIQEWYQIDTYNLYQSDPQGVSYSIALENVRSTKQPEENVLIDILEVNVSVLKKTTILLTIVTFHFHFTINITISYLSTGSPQFMNEFGSCFLLS